jgi:hypothetical protein
MATGSALGWQKGLKRGLNKYRRKTKSHGLAVAFVIRTSCALSCATRVRD